MKYLQDKTVLLLGLGISGLAMAQWCYQYAARVVVVDNSVQPKHLTKLQQSCPKITFVTAKFDEQLLEQYSADYLLVSPGIALDHYAKLAQLALKKKLVVVGELWLFAQALVELKQQQGYQPKILAITGTNGKTTVTALTAHLLHSIELDAVVAGNIGPSLMDILTQRLNTKLPQYWVLELSSFQLHWPSNLIADAAVILNITQDHLDWHGSLQAYSLAKQNIFADSTCRIINREQRDLAQSILAKNSSANYIGFSVDEPTRINDFGVVNHRGVNWLVKLVASTSGQTELQYLLPVNAMKIKGMHNASNALASLALLQAVGVEVESVLRGLTSYQGEPHRVQFVAVHQGIEYFDDSKATNVGATLAAVKGLSGRNKLVLILGGVGKGQDFTELAKSLIGSCRAVVFIGKDGEIIKKTMQQHAIDVDVQFAIDMQDAVSKASNKAKSGDVVLLSPACASLDMYANYAQRGDCFTQQVQQLIQDGGDL